MPTVILMIGTHFEVSVVYYCSMYGPEDFMPEDCWQTRVPYERVMRAIHDNDGVVVDTRADFLDQKKRGIVDVIGKQKWEAEMVFISGDAAPTGQTEEDNTFQETQEADYDSLDTEHQQDKTSNVKMVTEGLDGLGLYHPILSHPQELSPPTAMRTDNSLLPPLRNLSKKFGVSRLMIEMLSGEKRRGRVMNRKKNMRSLASEVVLLLWQLGLATERW
ncbi:hypothetical protein BY996DRAFT_8394599 [Phakopsora pachyrhizi]|nr:hypothetical protein BY996DRAFT_8394599 [Phakopsora pachyrhizi]